MIITLKKAFYRFHHTPDTEKIIKQLPNTSQSVLLNRTVLYQKNKYSSDLHSPIQNKGHWKMGHFAPNWLKVTRPLIQDSSELICFEMKENQQKTPRASFLITYFLNLSILNIFCLLQLTFWVVLIPQGACTLSQSL